MKSLLLLIALFFSIIINAQRVGIGTTIPIAKLEITGEGSNSSTNTLVLKNLIGDTLLRMRNDGRMGIGFNGPTYGRTINLGGLGINFYTDDAAFGGAAFPTDTSLVIWSNSNANNYLVLQPSWGNTGIGTYSPDAKLHVNGTFILGNSGSVLNRVVKVTVAKNLVSVGAGLTSIETFTVAGSLLGSTVYISPELALPDGLIIAYSRVSVAGTIEVKFTNTTTASIDPASMSFHITVIN